MKARYDVVVVGGGHNGLVAAAYLARAGRSVLVLERSGAPGGAAVSEPPFAGVDARLSRYSYLVSLLPRKIVAELGLRLQRAAAADLLVHAGRRDDRPRPARRHRRAPRARARLTGAGEYEAWQRFYGCAARVAERSSRR